MGFVACGLNFEEQQNTGSKGLFRSFKRRRNTGRHCHSPLVKPILLLLNRFCSAGKVRLLVVRQSKAKQAGMFS